MSSSETGTVPVTNTVLETGTPLGSIRNIKEITSSNLATVQQIARSQGIVLDDDAARKLVRRCRAMRADLTDAEIAYFTQIKISQLRNSRNIDNWVGMLIASVPAYFEGTAAELMRLRKQKYAEAKQSREVAQQILQDPEASDRDCEWARATLAQNAPPRADSA